MQKIYFLLFCLSPLIFGSPAPESLKLIHVLFRHGNRTPGITELYPKDPYLNKTYYPFGLGQLTNAGKRREYSIGQALRLRYDSFLGKYYYPELIEPVSTDYNRTKMSLELVLASLFQPRGVEVWNNDSGKEDVLNWQPVPYNYYPIKSDKVLRGVETIKYQKIYNDYTNSEQQQNKYRKHERVFKYLSNNTGLNVSSFLDTYNLYFGLTTEEEWGLKLPKWTAPVFPKTILDLAINEYFVQMGTTELIKEGVGYFLKKIVTDSQRKLKEEHMENKLTSRKVYMYSAHENNIADLLIALGVFKNPHIPNYGAYIVIELHKINNKATIRVFYENYTEDDIELINLPNCESYCDLNTFINNIQKYLPTD